MGSERPERQLYCAFSYRKSLVDLPPTLPNAEMAPLICISVITTARIRRHIYVIVDIKDHSTAGLVERDSL